MPEQKSGPSYLPTILATVLAAVFGVQIATRSAPDSSSGTSMASRTGSSRQSVADDRSEGWKLKFGKEDSIYDLVPARKPASDPEKHHPFLKPLAEFTGRDLDDFRFEEGKYVVGRETESQPTSKPVDNCVQAGRFAIPRATIERFFKILQCIARRIGLDCCAVSTGLTTVEGVLEQQLSRFGLVELSSNGDATTTHEPMQLEKYLGSRRYDCKYLIATVPSPVDPKQAYSFDLWVEALQRAVATAPSEGEKCKGARSYVLDSYWLPWVQTDQTVGGTSELYKTMPGLLLFRHAGASKNGAASSAKTDLLFVFLVGETPISGVRKQAFHAALDVVAQCQRALSGDCILDCDADPIIRIVGPAFSGSQTSLQTALVDWCNLQKFITLPRYEKSDGSCSNCVLEFDVLSTGTMLDPRAFSEAFHQVNGVVKAELHSTLQRDEFVTEALYRHLWELHGRGKGGLPIKVALLAEYSTSYGTGFSEMSNLVKKPTQKPNCDDSNFMNCFTFIDAPFPAHIAEVHESQSRQDELDRQKLP